jgi:hypothetical protein
VSEHSEQPTDLEIYQALRGPARTIVEGSVCALGLERGLRVAGTVFLDLMREGQLELARQQDRERAG